MNKTIADILANAKSGEVLAVVLCILTGCIVISIAHGTDGRCRVDKFDVNDAADYGCSTGLFFRGLFEQVPVFNSVKNNQP